MIEKTTKSQQKFLEVARKTARVAAVVLVMPFFLWLPLSLATSIPSMIDIFGIDGLRTPTGIVIAGLLLAAFGFEDFSKTSL